jgi:hypothetical protein
MRIIVIHRDPFGSLSPCCQWEHMPTRECQQPFTPAGGTKTCVDSNGNELPWLWRCQECGNLWTGDDKGPCSAMVMTDVTEEDQR